MKKLLLFSLSPLLFANTLTIYSSNMGMVNETKSFTLEKDKQILTYDNVASTIITDSVNVAFSEPITLFSQNFKYDTLSFDNLSKPIRTPCL